MAGGLAGIEVPIVGSDSVKWTELSFPSSPAAAADSDLLVPALTGDFASCSAVGDPPTYLSWRVQKSVPNCVELLELGADKEFPRTGTRFCFPEALSSLVFVCKNEVDGDSTKFPYLVCAVTERGIVYLVRVRNKSSATVILVPSSEEVVSVFDLRRASMSSSEITSGVAMPNGCLILGTTDGSLTCFQLATTPPSLHELRDDTGIARLWGLVSRGKVVDAVQDLAVSEFRGKQILFVLHLDGILRVWDLSNRTRISSHNMNVPAMAGATFVRLWVSKADTESAIFSLAILSRHTMDVSSETIMLYSLHCSLGDKLSLVLDPSVSPVSLLDGRCIDVKLASDKIWILKENGLLLRSMNEEETSYYTLQEEFVAEQLFQSPESSVDHLLLMSHLIFSPAKDKISGVVSSIFLRRLLHPGVYQSVALRATFLEYNRHTDIQSLTADGLKKEIMSVIEDEGVGADLISIFCSWKMFCARYFQNWCKSNAPCGLLIEPITGSVGLIRTNSVSLFRCAEDIEHLLHGSSTELGDLTSFEFNSFDDKHACEILVDLLRCVGNISQQLGKPASVLFYESLINRHVFPSEEIVPCILKVLETGYSSTVTAFGVSDFCTRISWEESLADHKNLRKFSINMLLSLHSLCDKATTWSKVLNVIENYLKFLVPQKVIETISGDPALSINASILIQATSQIAKVMFESSFDIVLFLGYLVNNSGQVHMMPDDISKIQLELVPMVQEIISEWLIIYFFTTTPSESAAVEDCSSQLSLLQIDSNTVRRSWNDKLGNCDFPLALIFLLNPQSARYLHSRHLPNSDEIVTSVRQFSSWIIWGKTGNSSTLFAHSTQLALIMLRHGQYDAVECLHGMVETHMDKEKTSESVDEHWCKLQHLRGCSLLAKAQRGFNVKEKERITSEAVRCFFRVSSVKGAAEALQSLPPDAGLPHLGLRGDHLEDAVWKLDYYEWAMQICEQYNISDGACQFALAALEQVEEAFLSSQNHPFDESATAIKGRLWANVFKFTLDLRQFYEAYCAIISNPDEESKNLCLRRFIIVLYEGNAIKILCGGKLPFIGLVDKVEQELYWKAERSDILSKPNLYKLLYAFEMNRHSWRKAASYIYRYASRLKTEAAQQSSSDLQERLNGLSAAINTLHLVPSAYAWIGPLRSQGQEHYPAKKPRKTMGQDQEGDGCQPQISECIDIEKIEDEFVLTSAEYFLSLSQVKWKFSEVREELPSLAGLLVQEDLYDMAFTVLLRFFKGSDLKRELERVFCAMALKCCPDITDSTRTRAENVLMLTSSKDEMVHCSTDMSCTTQQYKPAGYWVTLKLYLDKYKGFHARLPLIVAETLLRVDPQLELPLWLVNMFKDDQSEKAWRMTGQESSPALLFRLYVDYGRYTDATNLLLEYIESYASMRPSEMMNRKRAFGVWLPYTAIQQLWCKIEEAMRLGHMVAQCQKLKSLLQAALLRHLSLLKVDSDDACAAASASASA